MNKFATTFCLLIVSMTLFSQGTLLHIHGTVADSDGVPVSEVPVFISTSFSDSTFFFIDAITGPDGQYEAMIDVVSGDLGGTIFAAIPNCDGTLLEQQVNWQAQPNTTDPVEVVIDFEYCAGITIDSICFVFIAEEINPNGEVQLTAYTPFPIAGNVSYTWDNGDTTQSIVPDEAATYCVTADFSNTCSAVSCYDYFPDSNGNCWSYIDVIYQNLDSVTGSDLATLTVVATGQAPFTYAWDNGMTGASIEAGPGIYCVTVTDAEGCISETCTEVFDFLFCEAYITHDPAGSLLAIAFGVEPLTYLWSTGDSTMSINPQIPGEYCVTVTDATGCEANTCTVYDTLVQIDTCLSFITFYVDSITGGGNPTDSSLTLLVTSFGEAPFTYLWNTGETSSAITVPDLSEIYCVTVTDASGCVSVACSDIWNNFCYSWVEVQYLEEDLAVLDVFTESPAPAISWTWSNGETGPSITVTESGTYCVNVMDENGCMSEACAWVDFGFAGDSCEVIVIPYIGNDSMNAEFVVEALAFGQAPFTYNWSDGSTSNTTTVQDPNELLCVTVTDANGCVSEACLQDFIDPCLIHIEFGFNGQDSTITLSVNAPFGITNDDAFLWSTGDTTQTITVSEDGTYCVTATLVNGCTSTACLNVITTPVDTTFNFLNGFVYGSANEQFTGHVYAYQLLPIDSSDMTGQYTLVDSAQILSGNFYAFTNLPSGVYLLKAVLDEGSAGADDYFPSYHVDAIEWDDATPVVLPNWLPVTTDIFMQPVNNAGGGGIIGGTLLDPDGLLADAGTASREGGLSGIQINLIHQVAGNYRYAITDEDGNFYFDNLPWGTYKVTYDYLGHDAAEVWVTIGPNNPENTSVIINSSGTSVSTEDLKASTTVEVFPNPATNRTSVRLSDYSGELELRMLTMNGQVLLSNRYQYTKGENLELDLSSLENGMFLIELITSRGKTTEMIIKH